MKNYQLHGFDPMPVADAHLHHLHPVPPEETLKIFREILSHFNYERVLLAALTPYFVTDNVLSFYCKAELSPVAYTLSSLNHHYDERDTAEFFLSEIRKYHAMGCDGIKMLEGKPETHRRLTTPKLSHKVYEPFFAYAEENGIPLLMHLGDPSYFWDRSQMTPYQLEHGWFVGPEEPTLEELRSEVEEVLIRHPKLRLTLAHFYFMENELDRLDRLLDRFENLCLDLTPGDHFPSLCTNRENARAFFQKHQRRILFGTDTYNFPAADREKTSGVRPNLTRRALEGKESFTEDGVLCRPLELEREVLEQIYRKNFVRLYGQAPRPLDHERIAAECRLLGEERTMDENQRQRLLVVRDFFETKR